uniref:Tesmin/TSO1-like CXC domain-containing protein n=1 Tax=Kalanchoe fedtschenkoi TaxID=63787 RepID=A0A7N0V319_KALFE
MKRYQKRVQELEQEKQALQKENEELKSQVANVLTSSDGGGQKVKEYYLKKLTGLEDQVSELKRKLEGQSQVSCQKPRRDDWAKAMQEEIAALKAQKAELQRKMKEESVHFRLGKALLEKEVLQLKKDVRMKDYKLDKLIVFSSRLKMVLQRKIEEAFMATKRLNDLFESRKASPNDKGIGAGDLKCQKDKDQVKKERNDAKMQIRGICSKYERQLQEISCIANGENEMKKYTEMPDQIDIGTILQDIDDDCRKKDLEIRDLLQEVRNNHRGKESEIRDLKEQVAKLSSLVRQLDMHNEEPRKKLQHSTLKGSSTVKTANESGSSIIADLLGRKSSLSDVTNTTGLSQSGGTSEIGKKGSDATCCSCSSKSTCKTNKCKCRATGGSCGSSCGCAPSKCANREATSIKLDKTPESEETDTKDNSSDAGHVEQITSLASHGATLPENAFVADTKETDHNGGSRVPLSDVGNIQVCFISFCFRLKPFPSV